MAVQVDLKDPLLTYTKPCYIPGPGIFRTGGIFKTMWKYDQKYSELCNSPNSLFRHYSAIFKTLCNGCIYAETWHVPHPVIFRTFHNCNPTHIQKPVTFIKIGKPCVTVEIQTPGILTILECPELWHI